MTHRIVFTVLAAVILVASSAAAGTVDENKELIAKFIEASNAQDFENLPDFITDDFIRHSQASPEVVIASKDQFKTHMRDGLELFPDARLDVKQVVAEGDRVAIWASYRGTFRGQASGDEWVGPKLDVDIAAIFRVEGERIAEMWVTWDNKAIRTQLDAQGVADGR